MKIKVLFVTQGCDAVLYRYNLGWLIEEMDRSLFDITVVDCCKLDITPLIKDHHFIMYYRVLSCKNTAIDYARNIGKFVGYLIDDYLMDFPFAGEMLNVMQRAHMVFVTTKVLKKQYIDAGVRKLFYIKKHGLPLEKLLALKKPGQLTEPARFRLGWLGGFTHGQFVGRLDEILKGLTSAGVPITFICFGKPADFIERVGKIPNIQVQNLPFIPFNDEIGYYSTLANLALDAVINVLEPTRLSQGKSELKFLETGMYKYPLITSKVGIFKEIIRDGKNGFLANRPEEFAEKVLYLQKNPVDRAKIAEAAHQEVLAHYHIRLQAREFEGRLLKFFVANAPGGWKQWGRFIKAEKPGVYFWAFGAKHLVPNPRVLRKLKCGWDDIQVVSEKEINAIPNGVTLDLTEEEFI